MKKNMVDKNKIKSQIRYKKTQGWLGGIKWFVFIGLSWVLIGLVALLTMINKGVEASAEKGKIDSARNFAEAEQLKQEAEKDIEKENKVWLKGLEREDYKLRDKEIRTIETDDFVDISVAPAA